MGNITISNERQRRVHLKIELKLQYARQVELTDSQTQTKKKLGCINHSFRRIVSAPALPIEGMTLIIETSYTAIRAKVNCIEGFISPDGVCRYVVELTFEAFSDGDSDTEQEEKDMAIGFAKDDVRVLLDHGFVAEGIFCYTKSDQKGPVIHGEPIQFTR